ncbi:MAG: hypothetical protein C4291_14290 [Candidatus Dadabacteria bacterium]
MSLERTLLSIMEYLSKAARKAEDSASIKYLLKHSLRTKLGVKLGSLTSFTHNPQNITFKADRKAIKLFKIH